MFRNPFGYFPRKIRLFQRACYAPIVNKANFRNM